jgi:hypothetical protein
MSVRHKLSKQKGYKNPSPKLDFRERKTGSLRWEMLTWPSKNHIDYSIC